MGVVLKAFDDAAATYDRQWSRSPAGRVQREAVWRQLPKIFRAGNHVLDLGCGTGEDAEWLLSRGVQVTAIDPSAEMVRRARAKGVTAMVGDIRGAVGSFDGVLSNFAALNCVADPSSLREPLSSLVRRGGHLALCMFGKVCAWETVWYGLQFDWQRATRRWGPKTRSKSLDVDVYYPPVAQVRAALEPDFVFLYAAGIGLLTPPSYVRGLSGRAVRAMGVLDRALACVPGLRSLCDHQLLVFRRG
jgi:SAM-dependent methyltransferase